MHVAFFEVKDWERAYLSERLPSDQTSFSADVLANPGPELRGLNALSVFIYSHVSRDVLEALPELKFVATRSTGFDHIDVEKPAASAESSSPMCLRTAKIP
jgi:D-lactate dehydrogenase